MMQKSPPKKKRVLNVLNVLNDLIRKHDKKLSYRRGTARCVVVVPVEILPTATQQCRNYLHDKFRTNRSYEIGGLRWADV